MKKYMKTGLSLLLALLVLTLSACGGKDDSSGSGGKSPDGAPPAAASPDNAAPDVGEDGQLAPDWTGATFSLGTLNPENNPDSVAAQWFADTLSEKTGGRLKVNVYPHSQLGAQSAQIEALTMGTQDFFVGGIEPFASIANELNIMTVFFMFETQEQFQAFFQSDYFKSAEEKLAAENIAFINKACNWVKGPYRILLSTKEIDGSLESIKGLTIRIPDQEVFQKSWSALGATPIVLALNETYLAMQQGLVNGLDLIPASIASNGFQEVTKYILRTDAFPQREGVFMSKSALDTLPPEIQELIYETADAAGEYYTELVEKNGESIMQECRDLGIVVIEDADLSDWYAACADLGYDLEASGYLPSGITDAVKAMK